MNKISEYDKRQLNSMIKNLIAFENKQIELSSLVCNLESLLHIMERVSDEWEEKFLNEFSILESINAEMPKMPKDDIEQLINEAIINLKKIVTERLIS